jgi:hypothetical protein
MTGRWVRVDPSDTPAAVRARRAAAVAETFPRSVRAPAPRSVIGRVPPGREPVTAAREDLALLLRELFALRRLVRQLTAGINGGAVPLVPANLTEAANRVAQAAGMLPGSEAAREALATARRNRRDLSAGGGIPAENHHLGRTNAR